jgi:hypothetical protein
MVNKRGQLKIQQMMFMIIGVTILFALVGVFFLSISLSKLNKISQETQQNNALLLVSKLAKSPEFSCGNVFGSVSVNCVDFDKLIALVERQEQYSGFWGVAKIEIKKIYPKNDTWCTKDNYPDCGRLIILNNSVKALAPSSTFISLCRKDVLNGSIYDKCELAKLIISGEDKS